MTEFLFPSLHVSVAVAIAKVVSRLFGNWKSSFKSARLFVRQQAIDDYALVKQYFLKFRGCCRMTQLCVLFYRTCSRLLSSAVRSSWLERSLHNQRGEGLDKTLAYTRVEALCNDDGSRTSPCTTIGRMILMR